MCLPDIEAKLQQIVDVTCNDRKQRLIQGGQMTNSCSYNCDICPQHKDLLHVMPTDQYERAKELGLVDADREHQTYEMRVGNLSNIECFKRYTEETKNGTIRQTEAAAKETHERSLSINNKPLRQIHPTKILPDPMHTWNGLFNHFLQHVRLSLRAIDDKSDFFQSLLATVKAVEIRLDEIGTTKRKGSQVSSKVTAIHKESLKLRREIKAQLKKINDWKEKREELEEEEMFDENAFDEKLLLLTAEYDELNENFKQHIKDSGYGHYVQEFTGLSAFSEAASKFMLPSCKKPHGILEFLLIQLIKYLVGVDFRKENGGFDLSGGDAMDTCECFPQISKTIVSSIDPSDPSYQHVKHLFDGFERVADCLLNWGRALKSQERVAPARFLDTLLLLIATWDDVFPDVPYFPKMHDNFHYPPFVLYFEFCGRGSAEGSESSNVRRKEIMDRLKSVISMKQKYSTSFARTHSSLKDGMSRPAAAIAKQMSGKKRGKRAINSSTRRTNSVTTIALSEQIVKFEEEEYLVIPGNGLINTNIKDFYMLMANSRAPAAWMETIKPLLSDSRAEQAQRTFY